MALIDEGRGRKVAIKHGVRVTGSAAILLNARHCGKVDRIKPLLKRLRNHRYRLSDQLIKEAPQRAGKNCAYLRSGVIIQGNNASHSPIGPRKADTITFADYPPSCRRSLLEPPRLHAK